VRNLQYLKRVMEKRNILQTIKIMKANTCCLGAAF
jgi:hypothetical protein